MAMTLSFPNITLGTAGHIDHGKTALIKFLTGCETDRLPAEKTRGMSIDLGFAPCTVGTMQVGIVDVPGHEDFIRTMVAGASGMDGVIFVVAADDGVMPQSREHLEILTLLGIRHGIVVLTKIDRVEPADMQAAHKQVRTFLQGTFLEAAPVLPVCNLTGEGFAPFHQALHDLVSAIEPKRTDGVFRLPVDRAFSVKGIGTVVAGIPVSGQAGTGDEVVLLPAGISGRIRAIEAYKRKTDRVVAGQCAALNIPHWEPDSIARGHVVASPGFFAPQQWYVTKLELLPHADLALKSGARVRLHTGTSETVAAVYPLQSLTVRGGTAGLAQLKLEEPLAAGPGDRFIIRTLSPARTVGGGSIVAPAARRLKRSRVDVTGLEQAARALSEPSDQRAYVEHRLRRTAKLAVDEGTLSADAKIPVKRLRQILAELSATGKAVSLSPTVFIHSQTLAATEERLLDIVRRFHAESPASPGIPATGLGDRSGIDRTTLGLLIARLQADSRLRTHNQRLALAAHRPALPAAQQAVVARLEALFLQEPFRPPSRQEAGGRLGLTAADLEHIFQLCLEHEVLVQVAPTLFFHRQALERARDILESFLREQGRLESVKFKYLLDTTRKFAIPLLDYFDRIGVTRRSGHTRYLPYRGPAANDN